MTGKTSIAILLFTYCCCVHAQDITVESVPYQVKWEHGEFGECFYSVTDSRFVCRYWAWIPEHVAEPRVEADESVSATIKLVNSKALIAVVGYDGDSFWLVVYPDHTTWPNVEKKVDELWVLPSSEPAVFTSKEIDAFSDRRVFRTWSQFEGANPFLGLAMINAFARTLDVRSFDRAALLDTEVFDNAKLIASRNSDILHYQFGAKANPFLVGLWECYVNLDNHESHSLLEVHFVCNESWGGDWPYFYPSKFQLARLQPEKVSNVQFSPGYYLNESQKNIAIVNIDEKRKEKDKE